MKRLSVPTGARLVVTAGPTREFIDPVRFLSNPSTGKMGFAVARAAAARGWDVRLIAGPVALKTPENVKRIDVVSARDMLAAVEREISGAMLPFTVLVSSAAVADWRPAECAAAKLKKTQMDGVLRLVRNPDILKTIAGKIERGELPVTLRLVGFAAETGDPVSEALRKCREKRLAMVVANDVAKKGAGFGTDTNEVALVKASGAVIRLPMMSKLSVARRIVKECETLALDARG